MALNYLKTFVVFCLPVFLLLSSLRSQNHEASVLAFQEELNQEYQNPEKSPLDKKARKKFHGHDFFPIDSTYRVRATFERVENAVPFQMETSTDRKPIYELYAVATFIFEGKEWHLNIYQSHRLRLMEKYKTYLFLPFKDLTNGKTTYGGGRYMDLEIPEGDYIWIDFNKAYNPFCAYSYKYSCPIPPKENALDFAVEAGIKLKKKKKK